MATKTLTDITLPGSSDNYNFRASYGPKSVGNSTTSIYLDADGVFTAGTTISDTKVKLTSSSTNAEYPLLFSSSTNPTSGTASDSLYNLSIKVNPGLWSLMSGFNNTASGYYSFATGLGIIANQPNMTAIGQYNESGTTYDLFAVGNGSSASYRRTVFKIGGAPGSPTALANVDMHGYFTVGDSSDANASIAVATTTTGSPSIAFLRGSSTDDYTDWLEVNDGGILRFKTRNSNGNWTERVKFDGGTVYASNFSQTSDINKKNIISDISLEKAYDLVDKCQTILYTLKDDPLNKELIGLIAQEVQQFFPEIVETTDDGTLALSYSRLTVIILKVLKDIIARLNKLEKS